MGKRNILLASANDDFDDRSEKTGLACEDKSLAVQSDADDADINTIVRRFGLTGQLPQNVRVPMQDDFVEAMSFQEAQNAMIDADRSFMRMPADVRARFQNDPGQFVEFCSNPDNLEEMRKLG